ncbi:MAG: hypothetical protein CMJ54_03605 [Planctomycetaceae bacterium]|nr:hypothetical protein [Planctomycetaceae bacterium]
MKIQIATSPNRRARRPSTRIGRTMSNRPHLHESGPVDTGPLSESGRESANPRSASAENPPSCLARVLGHAVTVPGGSPIDDFDLPGIWGIRPNVPDPVGSASKTTAIRIA